MPVAIKEDEILLPEKTGFPVPDVRLKKSQTFPRYVNLRDSSIVIDLTLDQEIEWLKCAQDPVYFAKNYYKITSVDKGFILFDPFPYQEELIRAFHEHRFVIDVQCRQSGKCVDGETIIKIRNKKTKEVKELTIGEFHELMKSKTLTSKPTTVALYVRELCKKG